MPRGVTKGTSIGGGKVGVKRIFDIFLENFLFQEKLGEIAECSYSCQNDPLEREKLTQRRRRSD